MAKTDWLTRSLQQDIQAVEERSTGIRISTLWGGNAQHVAPVDMARCVEPLHPVTPPHYVLRWSPSLETWVCLNSSGTIPAANPQFPVPHRDFWAAKSAKKDDSSS